MKLPSPAIALSLLLGLGTSLSSPAGAQTTNATPVLEINAGQVTGPASPTLYGLMTEDINYALEGGLYGELIRNRSFKASTTEPAFWKPVGSATITLDFAQPLNSALNVSLKLDAGLATAAAPAGFANGGYYGIPVRPDTTYRPSFYARTDGKFSGPVTVALTSADGKTTFASAKVSHLTDQWNKYEVSLKTRNVPASKNNLFVITAGGPGVVWFSEVSLFPPTYNDRPNGLRPDLMQLLGEMHPQFLRFPGGNYLEGNEITNRFNWKTTLGDPAQRPGHMNDGWGYWSTDGLGLLEFLEWCEDLHMQPVLAVYAGYSMHQHLVNPGDDLQPYVQDALDEIEYVTGATTTRWGAQRAQDGHPAPFALNYVEIGNEDWFDTSGSYDARFTQFYKAIKARHPQLTCISTVGSSRPRSQLVHSVRPDMLDDHYYRSQQEMRLHANDYDKYDRTGPKIFVGEWATRVGSPTPNLAGALGDAAWMTGMERNSDVILISSYAPLFVNVSDIRTGGGRNPNSSMQWPTDLVGYDALNCYGSPAFYAQKMFSLNHGDQILATDAQNLPNEEYQPPARRARNAPATADPNAAPAPLPPKQTLPSVFFDATRDSKTGTIYVKIVNIQATAQPVEIKLDGVASVAANGEATVLSSASEDDTNTLNDPQKVVPHTAPVRGVSRDFTQTLAPWSITILKLAAK